MNKKTAFAWLCFCLLAGFSISKAQSTKFFVAFKDKAGTPYTVGNPGAFLSQKSVNRRTYYNIAANVTDLPVTPSYIAQVAAINNVKVIHAVKWLNGVVIQIDTLQPAALALVNSLPFVSASKPTNRIRLNPLEDPAPPVGVAAAQQGQRATSTQSYNTGGSHTQNEQIHVDCLHELGFMGQGITIAVMDVGFTNVDNNPVFAYLRNRGGILGTRDFVSGGTSVYEDPVHGEYVLSCMAATSPGLIGGSAPLADYWLLRTEDDISETPTEEYNWVRAAEFADSVGADILTTSLGYTTFDNASENNTYATLDGRTAPMSIAANMAARKGLFVLNAAGNEGGGGWQYIAVPADADSICTVGAIDKNGVVAGFSSTGPTADGRIKPDLVAMGVNAWISDPSGICFPGNGTSFATPILAGGIASFWSANRWLNNMQILQLLKASGSNAVAPDSSKGWGIPNLCTAAPLGIIQRSSSQQDFVVSPNPFNTALQINFYDPGTKIIRLELTDLLGNIVQLINTPVVENSSMTLSTVLLPEGVYFIRLHTSSGVLTKKIIKQ